MGMVVGDARSLPVAAGSVQCVVTSPPYWGLRDYGVAGQLGLESTPDEYVANMVAVFREVWRVLRDDGTLWLNLGSSYFGAKGGDTHSGFNERYFGKPFATDKQSMTPFPENDGKPAILSRQRQRVPACGSDGTELPDLTASDSACSCLCDGCLADYLSHRDRIVGSGPLLGQSAPPPSQTARGSERLDCAASSLASWPLDVLASTTLESWRRHRGACSRCDSRASALSGLRSSSADAPAFAGMTWANYTTRLKQKDMVPIPWMVAMALQADGWYLRQDIIWAKPNPMPESVRDRCTKAHEYLFLLTKRQKYFYDAEAIAEPVSPDMAWRAERGYTRGGNGKVDASRGDADTLRGEDSKAINGGTRNRRSVWTVNTQPYPEAHFATFPEKLVEPCVLAGTKPGDLVLDPFAGSGTVGAVCRRLARRFVWVELNPAYVGLAVDRLRGQRGLALEVA